MTTIASTVAASPAPAVSPEQAAQDTHNAAMVAKVDASTQAALDAAGVKPQAAEPTATARPDHIPAKFWDATKGEVMVDALAKSYAELEKRPAPKVADPATTTPAEPQQAAPAPTPEPASKAIDLTALSDEYATEGGKLTDKTYAALAAKGYDKALVDTYIAGQVALQSSAEAALFATVGGKDNFTKMAQWAMANLTSSEIDAIDSNMVKGGEHAKMATSALNAKFQAANGSAPKLLGGNAAAASVQGYASNAEMVRDMQDPRYRNDPAYQARVYAKLAATP